MELNFQTACPINIGPTPPLFYGDSMYEKIKKEQEKALGVFYNSVDALKKVSASIQNMKDINATSMQDARKEIAEREEFIEKKATSNSMLQVDLDKNNDIITKINEVINVR